MSIESKEDLIALRKIGRIVARVLQAMKSEVRPGRKTAEIDQVALDPVAHRDGGREITVGAASGYFMRLRMPSSSSTLL